MIRLFPKFWKLNSNSHHRIKVLSMAADLRYPVVEAYHECSTYTLNTVTKTNIWFSLSCCTQSKSRERSKTCITQIWSSSTLWLNKDQKSWYVGFVPDSTFHFLRTNHSLCLRSSTYICTSLWTWLCPWDGVLCATVWSRNSIIWN